MKLARIADVLTNAVLVNGSLGLVGFLIGANAGWPQIVTTTCAGMALGAAALMPLLLLLIAIELLFGRYLRRRGA